MVSHESLVRGFKTLGIKTALDGSDNPIVNIPKFPNYEMPTEFLEEEYAIIDSDDDSASSLSKCISDDNETSNVSEDE